MFIFAVCKGLIIMIIIKKYNKIIIKKIHKNCIKKYSYKNILIDQNIENPSERKMNNMTQKLSNLNKFEYIKQIFLNECKF